MAHTVNSGWAAIGAVLLALAPVAAGRAEAGQRAPMVARFPGQGGLVPADGGVVLPPGSGDVPASTASFDNVQGVFANRTAVIIAGIRSGDVSGIMELYAPGAVYSPSADSLLAERRDIEAFWIGVANSQAHDARLEVLQVEWLAPDAILEIQKYDVFDAQGGRLFGGHASLLWRRIGGRWLIAVDVSN